MTVEGAFANGVPYLRAGQGPPLLMASGLTAQNANPTGRWRKMAMSYVAPFARALHRVPDQPPARTGSRRHHVRHRCRLRRCHRGRHRRAGVRARHLDRRLARTPAGDRPSGAGAETGRLGGRVPALGGRPPGAGRAGAAHGGRGRPRHRVLPPGRDGAAPVGDPGARRRMARGTDVRRRGPVRHAGRARCRGRPRRRARPGQRLPPRRWSSAAEPTRSTPRSSSAARPTAFPTDGP